jgi:hypothetical protein
MPRLEPGGDQQLVSNSRNSAPRLNRNPLDRYWNIPFNVRVEKE